MEDRRFPRSVYGVGEEPDPRFSLANERTFLAWIRTSLALVAVGIGVEALAAPVHPVPRIVAAGIFVGLGMVAAVHSWLTWARTERALRQNRALSGPTTGAIVAIGVVLGIAALVVGFFL